MRGYTVGPHGADHTYPHTDAVLRREAGVRGSGGRGHGDPALTGVCAACQPAGIDAGSFLGIRRRRANMRACQCPGCGGLVDALFSGGAGIPREVALSLLICRHDCQMKGDDDCICDLHALSIRT